MYEKYSTRDLSLDTPPRAVFFIHTRGGALTNTYIATSRVSRKLRVSQDNEKAACVLT